MNLKTILEKAEKHAERAIASKINDDLLFPGKPGVYLIYRNKKVIYIGQSSNLRNRFKQHLSPSQSPKRSTFRRILVREFGIEPQNTKDWIVENCSISSIEINDFGICTSDMCKLVESLLIAHFRARNKDLLNSCTSMKDKKKKKENGA